MLVSILAGLVDRAGPVQMPQLARGKSTAAARAFLVLSRFRTSISRWSLKARRAFSFE